MDIYFRTKKLQKSCNFEKDARQFWGAANARKLMMRLQELNAADCLADIPKIPPPRCHELGGDRKGQISVDVQHPYRLIFIPANDPVPFLSDGGLNWARVTEIEIIEIVDTH